MRLIISFFLSLFIYFLILLFLYFTFFQKKEKKQEVLIHTAIITPKIKKHSLKAQIKKQSPSKKIKQRVKRKVSKTNITKGGNIDFNDIFKNVKDNIPTKKLKLKKENVLSRFKAKKIIEQLKNIKNINVNISYNTSSTLTKEKIDELIKKIGEVWYEISDIAGEYATIKFVNDNGNVNVYILNSNLSRPKQNELINRLKNIKFDKNIDLTVKFQTKVNK